MVIELCGWSNLALSRVSFFLFLVSKILENLQVQAQNKTLHRLCKTRPLLPLTRHCQTVHVLVMLIQQPPYEPASVETTSDMSTK